MDPWRRLIDCIQQKVKNPGAYYWLETKMPAYLDKDCGHLSPPPANVQDMKVVLDELVAREDGALHITCDNGKEPTHCAIARYDEDDGVVIFGNNTGLVYCKGGGCTPLWLCDK